MHYSDLDLVVTIFIIQRFFKAFSHFPKINYHQNYSTSLRRFSLRNQGQNRPLICPPQPLTVPSTRPCNKRLDDEGSMATACLYVRRFFQVRGRVGNPGVYHFVNFINHFLVIQCAVRVDEKHLEGLSILVFEP